MLFLWLIRTYVYACVPLLLFARARSSTITGLIFVLGRVSSLIRTVADQPVKKHRFVCFLVIFLISCSVPFSLGRQTCGSDLESLLLAHPSVAEATVLPRAVRLPPPDGGGDNDDDNDDDEVVEVPVAVVVPDAQAAEEMRRWDRSGAVRRGVQRTLLRYGREEQQAPGGRYRAKPHKVYGGKGKGKDERTSREADFDRPIQCHPLCPM